MSQKEEWVRYPRGKAKPNDHMIFGTRVYFADETDRFIIQQEAEIAELREAAKKDRLTILGLLEDIRLLKGEEVTG